MQHAAQHACTWLRTCGGGGSHVVAGELYQQYPCAAGGCTHVYLQCLCAALVACSHCMAMVLLRQCMKTSSGCSSSAAHARCALSHQKYRVGLGSGTWRQCCLPMGYCTGVGVCAPWHSGGACGNCIVAHSAVTANAVMQGCLLFAGRRMVCSPSWHTRSEAGLSWPASSTACPLLAALGPSQCACRQCRVSCFYAAVVYY